MKKELKRKGHDCSLQGLLGESRVFVTLSHVGGGGSMEPAVVA